MLKKYDGAGFVSAPTKVYNGATWDYADVKSYDGTNWNYINPIQYDEDLSNGLVSYYNFEGDATDQVGSNDGTVSGATYTSSGKVDGCYSFDGSNDIIQQTSPSFASDDVGSFSIWVKATSTTGSGEVIMSQSDTSGNEFFPIYWRNDGNKSIQIASIVSSSVTSNMGTRANIWNDTNWHHIVVTSDGSTYKLYFDGVDETLTVNAGSNNGNWFNSAGSTYFTLGGLQRSSLLVPFGGLIDEVGIWNRTLSQAEVTKLYNNSNARYYK